MKSLATQDGKLTAGGTMRGSSKLFAAALSLAALVLWPSVASATVEAGHPELYDNNVFFGGGKTSPLTILLSGQVHLEAEQLGSGGVECAAAGFGDGWNEGAAARAIGSLLSWYGEGHLNPLRGGETFGASCIPETAGRPAIFLTSEPPVASQENVSHEEEPALRTQTTPWNYETRCGVRGEEETAIVELGVPTSEFPRSAPPQCPANLETGQAEEEAAYKKEREEKKGCYVSSPAPPGCIMVTLVNPATGFEESFGGTLWLHTINGVHNGLTATHLKLEGGASGELQCELPKGCHPGLIWRGDLIMVGRTAFELVKLL